MTLIQFWIGFILVSIGLKLFSSYKENKAKYDKKSILADYIVSKHQNGEIKWQHTFTSHYQGYLDGEELNLHIFSDGTCWIWFESHFELKLKSEKLSKLKIIMQDIQKANPEALTGIDKILSKLKIDNALNRDTKINKVLQDESIIQKVKRVFITKDI